MDNNNDFYYYDEFEQIIDDFPKTQAFVIINRLINLFDKMDHDIVYYRNYNKMLSRALDDLKKENDILKIY